jgi:aspartate-semialdehyde dehydrogenase
MLKVGFVGWRGLVGSVLLDRMRACGDFEGLVSGFFTTSNVGGDAPQVPGTKITSKLLDAFDISALADYEVIITCQGGDYTSAVHPRLRESGWSGYWIDAASALRMEDSTVLILDPINADVITQGLAEGHRDYCGANCTVSLMLMGLGGLFKAGLVEWVTSMTYQAASGAGAQSMRELAVQMRQLSSAADAHINNPAASALDIDRAISTAMSSTDFPTDEIGAPLAGSLLPWIDKPMKNGQSREEWKAFAEGNKILASQRPVPMDGVCVRVATMRCHAQAFTMKLTRNASLDEITTLISEAHPWVYVVENTPQASKALLTPANVTGKLDIPVGRLRKLSMGEDYLTAFSVGDQLLWGAAEPLRRMLRIPRTHMGLSVPDEQAA